MANAFGQFLRPSQEQQIADSYITEAGRGDRTAARRLNEYLDTQTAAQAIDPMAQHYEDVAEAQSQEDIYGRPGQEQQREDALTRILAPIRERGRFDVEQQDIQARGQMGAAQATAQGRQATQDASMARTQASQAGQAQRQRNQMLETQAKTAQGTSRNPLQWLMGAPSGEEQAATLRGQQQFGAQETGEQEPGLAQELFSEFQDATPEQVAAYAQSELGLSDPAAIQELIATYQALQGR